MAATVTPSAAPAAPPLPSTYKGPIPGGGQYGIYAAQATQAYQNALNQIQTQRQGFQAQSGFTNGMTPDANNPFGSYQQTQQANAQGLAQQDAANAGSGFMRGSGVLQQASGQQAAASQQGLSDFANKYAAQIAGFNQQGAQAGDTYQSNLVNALMTDIQNGISNGTFNPYNPGGAPTPAPAPGPTGGKGPAPNAKQLVGRIDQLAKDLAKPGFLTRAQQASYAATLQKLTGHAYRGKLGKAKA